MINTRHSNIVDVDMRRHWSARNSTFEQVESALTMILGGKEYLKTHTLSPYFHGIGRISFEHIYKYCSLICCLLLLDFECVLQLDNHQPVRCDQNSSMKNINDNKTVSIPNGCERYVVLHQ
jgi:hypothetical protein